MLYSTDCDELETFVAEPQNQFLDLELDFEEVRQVSAAIVFSEEDAEDIMERLESESQEVTRHVRDHKTSDDETVISFEGLEDEGN